MYDHLPEKLERRFTLGAHPEKRRMFFRKLVKLCDKYGEPCYRQIANVAAESQGKNKPGNYFCAAVARRLADHGYIEQAEWLEADSPTAGKVVA